MTGDNVDSLLPCLVDGTWEDLPAPVFPHLITLLSAKDCAALQLSCTSWYSKLGPAVAELSPNVLTAGELTERFPNITSLDLSRCSKYPESSLLLLFKLCKLAKIKLSNSDNYLRSSLKYPGFLALSRLRHLTHLALERFWAATPADMSPLTSLTALSSLCLRWSCAVGEGYQGIPTFPRLRQLQLVGMEVCDAGLIKVSLHRHLIALHLDLTQSQAITPAGLQHLSCLRGLQRLSVAVAEHLPVMLDALVPLHSTTSLTSLELIGLQLCSSKGFRSLSNFRAVEHLVLSSFLQTMQSIPATTTTTSGSGSSEGAIPMMALASCTSLTLHSLPLERMRFADVTASPRLQRLSLCMCSLSAQTLAHLPSCTRLEEVALLRCGGSFAEGLRSLAWTPRLTRLALEVPAGATMEQLGALSRLRGLQSAAFTGPSGCPLEGRLLQRLLPALTALTALHLRNVRDTDFCQALSPSLAEDLRMLSVRGCCGLTASAAVGLVRALPSLQAAVLEVCDLLSEEDCVQLAAAPRLAALNILLQQGGAERETWSTLRRCLAPTLDLQVSASCTPGGDGDDAAQELAWMAAFGGGGTSRRQTRTIA